MKQKYLDLHNVFVITWLSKFTVKLYNSHSWSGMQCKRFRSVHPVKHTSRYNVYWNTIMHYFPWDWISSHLENIFLTGNKGYSSMEIHHHLRACVGHHCGCVCLRLGLIRAAYLCSIIFDGYSTLWSCSGGYCNWLPHATVFFPNCIIYRRWLVAAFQNWAIYALVILRSL